MVLEMTRAEAIRHLEQEHKFGQILGANIEILNFWHEASHRHHPKIGHHHKPIKEKRK